MKTLFTSLIRPNVEYGCQIWNPTKRQEIVELEMVQRRFIKRIEGIEHLTYPEQLKKLKLYSLERRRREISDNISLENAGKSGTEMH